MLPLIPYLVTLVAGADAAVARALLTDGHDEQLRAELTEVSRSRARLADAFEAERRRIERDLRDGAQQRLVSLTLQLGLARLDLHAHSPAAAAVAAAHEQAKQLMAELRELFHGIQPQVLTDLGLPAAIGELADQSPIPVTVATDLAGRLPGQVETTAREHARRSGCGGRCAGSGVLVGVRDVQERAPDQGENDGRPGEGEPERRGDAPRRGD